VRGVGRAGLVLAALAVVMLAFAGTTDAKKKKKKHKVAPVVTATATATGTVEGQSISATATCPAGTRAVGGGFATPPLPPDPQDSGVATASHKVGANQWFAAMQVIGTPGPPVVLTTTAYCRKGAPVTTPVSTSTSLPQSSSPPFAVTPSNASCGAKQVQLSGGFSASSVVSSSDFDVLPLSSNRVDPLTWQVTGLGVTAGQTIVSQADCANQRKAKKGKNGKKKKVKKLVTPTEVTGDVISAGGSSVATATAIATCPSNLKPVNGGFSQPGALTGSSPFFYFLTESQAVGNAWHVSGFNESSGAGTLRSHGYCSR